MKKILVAGGAGFVGSHLIDKLIKNSHVHCIDNLQTGSKKNIQHLINNSNFKFIKGDIINKKKFEYDEIWNLACPASPLQYQVNPIFTLKTSVIGSLNLLESAKHFDSKIFLASTSEIYGDPKVHPQKEKYFGNVNTVGPRSCYDEGKRAAETLFSDFYRLHNTNIRIARIFNTYGPRMSQNDGRVVSNFIVQALKGNKITIYGDGNQTRSFCYVDDLVSGLILLMKKNNIHYPINIGNPTELSIKKLASMIRDIIGNNVKIIYKKLPLDDPQKRKPDIGLAKSKLKWKPTINLQEGLLKTINYFSKVI